jgi:DNA sulfur modification protein DndB
MERSTLAVRSRKLFTLSAIFNATSALIMGLNGGRDFDAKREIASSYWDEVGKYFPEWHLVRERKITAGEVRQEYIHSHGIILHALGKVGNTLLRKEDDRWKSNLKGLKKIDWARSNSKLWEGRAMLGGRVQKAEQNVTLTTNLIKKFLGIQLSPEEGRMEEAYRRGRNGN